MAEPDDPSRVEGLTVGELQAVEAFLQAASIPLLRDTDTGALPRGTGALFEVNDRRFLVTAQHLFDGMDVEALAVPLGKYAAPMKTLGDLVMAHSKEETGPDIAVLELLNKDLAAEVAKHWRFLGPDNIGVSDPKATHVVLGYPEAMSTRTEEAVHARPLAMYTTIVPTPPAEELKTPAADWDLYFELNREGELLDGSTMKTPPLNGASGAPIFDIGPPPGGVWTPQKALRFVGVQSSALAGKWFRATSADVVRAFFEKI